MTNNPLSTAVKAAVSSQDLTPFSNPNQRKDIPRKSNRRGAKHLHKALQFRNRWPIGESLTADDFDAWAADRGYLASPPSRNSEAWASHVYKRNELRGKVNAGGVAVDMPPHLRFRVEVATQESYLVESTMESFTDQMNALGEVLYKAVAAKLKKLESVTPDSDAYAQLDYPTKIMVYHSLKNLRNLDSELRLKMANLANDIQEMETMVNSLKVIKPESLPPHLQGQSPISIEI